MESLLPWIIASLVFSFFFSGIEIAFLAANRLQMEIQSKQGSWSGRLVNYFLNAPSRFIGTCLIGNTLALVIFGNTMAALFEPWLNANLPESLNNEPSVLLIQTILSTLVILMTAEFFPKSVFLINPNFMVSALAVPFAIMYVVLRPVTFAILNISTLILKHVFRMDYSDEKPAYGLTDLNHFLRNMQKVSHDNEEISLDKKILHNALEFGTVQVRECMVPRTEIVGMSQEEGIDHLRSRFIETGHSKIVVFRKTIDDPLGYCHSAALFRNPQTLEEIITPIIIVAETEMANDLMVQMIREHRSLAIVVDEFGGTSGLISMEDIIEEIFGDIEDEHDADDLVEQQLDERTYLLSARLEVDYLNEQYHLKLPAGDYDTLGGLILAYTEDFPKKGDRITIPPFTFTILATKGNRIENIRTEININSEVG